jgi:hypothetical protein
MWYLYLDESGDLGFDFVHKKPSNFFTVTILVVKGMENNRALINAVKKTIKRKLDPKRKRKSIDTELKGERTSIKVKEFFYKQLANIPFEIFCMTMNKRRAFSMLADEKHRINHLQGKLDPHIPLDIYHRASDQEPGPQAADMFSWGVFRKYERKDKEWLQFFSDRVHYDGQYP